MHQPSGFKESSFECIQADGAFLFAEGVLHLTGSEEAVKACSKAYRCANTLGSQDKAE
jgi:hypothetical protein